MTRPPCQSSPTRYSSLMAKNTERFRERAQVNTLRLCRSSHQAANSCCGRVACSKLRRCARNYVDLICSKQSIDLTRVFFYQLEAAFEVELEHWVTVGGGPCPSCAAGLDTCVPVKSGRLNLRTGQRVFVAPVHAIITTFLFILLLIHTICTGAGIGCYTHHAQPGPRQAVCGQVSWGRHWQ